MLKYRPTESTPVNLFQGNHESGDSRYEMSKLWQTDRVGQDPLPGV